MSLFNRGGNTPSTIIIKEITRSTNESFGVSFIRGIEAECAKDMAKVGMGKAKSWLDERTK